MRRITYVCMYLFMRVYLVFLTLMKCVNLTFAVTNNCLSVLKYLNSQYTSISVFIWLRVVRFFYKIFFSKLKFLSSSQVLLVSNNHSKIFYHINYFLNKHLAWISLRYSKQGSARPSREHKCVKISYKIWNYNITR